jgi:hypothetical protein
MERTDRALTADPGPWPSLPRSSRRTRAPAAPPRALDDRWPELPDDDVVSADEAHVSAMWEWLREREHDGRVR